MIDVFDIIAFVVFGVLLVIGVVVGVTLGSLPGQLAERRKHPQAAAITVASWLGLGVGVLGLLWSPALLWAVVLWPLALVWAFVVRPFPAPQP